MATARTCQGVLLSAGTWLGNKPAGSALNVGALWCMGACPMEACRCTLPSSRTVPRLPLPACQLLSIN